MSCHASHTAISMDKHMHSTSQTCTHTILIHHPKDDPCPDPEYGTRHVICHAQCAETMHRVLDGDACRGVDVDLMLAWRHDKMLASDSYIHSTFHSHTSMSHRLSPLHPVPQTVYIWCVPSLASVATHPSSYPAYSSSRYDHMPRRIRGS